jgi:hypothetical protein
MASKGQTGNGTVLSIGTGTGTPETFTPIVQMRSWQFSGQEAKYEDLTNADSPTLIAGGPVVEESIPSVLQPGTMAVSGIFVADDPGRTALVTAYNAQTLHNFKLQLKAPAGKTTGILYAFAAYVQGQSLPDLDYSKISTIKVTLKISGTITETPAA